MEWNAGLNAPQCYGDETATTNEAVQKRLGLAPMKRRWGKCAYCGRDTSCTLRRIQCQDQPSDLILEAADREEDRRSGGWTQSLKTCAQWISSQRTPRSIQMEKTRSGSRAGRTLGKREKDRAGLPVRYLKIASVLIEHGPGMQERLIWTGDQSNLSQLRFTNFSLSLARTHAHKYI